MSSRIDRGKLKKLNEKEEAFLDNVFNPDYKGDLTQAYIDAGYDDGASAKTNSRKKFRELGEHVTLRSFDRFNTHIPWAIDQLVTLIKNTKNDNVKLKALQDLLDRSGLKTPTVIRHEDKTDPRSMTSKDVAREVAALLSKAKKAPDLKVVGGNDRTDD